MKILLVDNLVLPEEGDLQFLDLHPHLGLLGIAAIARNAGHSVDIFDPKRGIHRGLLAYDASLYDTAAHSILATAPDVVGFTTLGCSFLFAVRVAAILKRHEPDLPIMLGGPHATMLDQPILKRFSQFDVIVRHEADEILPDVLDHLESRQFKRIPGLSWRTSPRSNQICFTEGKPMVEDLDSLPMLSYDYYPVMELGLELLRVEAGRGCPFSCTFCSTASFFQRSFRLKSADRIVQELDLLHEKYGYVDFKLDHDMFTANRGKVIEFCRAVAGRGYRWRASARVDCVDIELLDTMAESGCVSLYFGIETGSVKLQESCKKRLDLSLVLPTLNHCRRVGIETTASFITGYLDETAEDQNDTLDMLGNCFRPACLPQLHVLVPEPGTPMFADFGPTIQYDGYGGKYNTDLVHEDDEALVTELPHIFQTYYFYPGVMPRAQHIFAVETVDLLRRVGPIVVPYSLRGFKGRLSQFVGEFRAFAEQRSAGDRPTAEMLESFIRWKFGPQHHLSSLFRLALVWVGPGTSSFVEPPTPQDFESHGTYQISPRVRVLDDIHDCERLLESIRLADGDEWLDDSMLGEIGTYIVDLSKRGTVFRIDPAVVAILDLFTTPQSYTGVLDLLRESGACPELSAELLEELIRKAIIVPSIAAAAATDQRFVSAFASEA